MEKIRIAIVDDHQPLRQGVRNILPTDHIAVVLEASTGQDFINQLTSMPEQDAPQLVLLDSRMPEMDGVETVRWLKREKENIRILMFSLFDNASLVLKMLAMGVNGYITKTSDPAEINTAIAMVMEKGFYYSPFIAEKVMESIHSKQLQLHPSVSDRDDQPKNKLTERERTFVMHACSGLKTAEIAAKMSISPNTVEVHKTNVFRKLKVNNSVNMVLKAIRLGLSE